MDQTYELVKVVAQVQQGIDFFTAHHLYRRADLYRQRFVYLRQQAIQMLHTRILKIVKEANTQSTLRVNELVGKHIMDIKSAIYIKPR